MTFASLLTSGLLRWRRRLLAAAGLLLAYALLGFFAVPALLEAKLPARLGQLLGREVQLQRARANPFTLSVTLEGFEVKDRDGSAFLGWERLYVNVQASSLVTRTLDFKAIELRKPFGNVVVAKGGRLNFSDILERLEGPSQAPAAAAPERPRDVAIQHLLVSDARLTLADQSQGEPFATTLGPLTVELKDFHTTYDRRNPYALSGRTEAGESFAWSGAFSVTPLRSEGTLVLENVRLPRYHPYFHDRVAFDLKEGLATARAAYRFEWSEGRHAAGLTDLALSLRDLRFGDPASGAVPVALPSVEVRGSVDLLAPAVDLASVVLSDGRVDVVRHKDGTVDLARLFTPKPRPEDPKAAPLKLSLKELRLQNFRLGFRDQATPRPVKLDLDGVNLSLDGFDLAPATLARLALEARVNGRGRLGLEGTAALLKPALDLKVKASGLDLAPFDPYLEPALDVRLTRGVLGLEGRFRGVFEGRPTDQSAYQGDLRLDGFEAMDGARSEPFLRYRSFRLQGVDVRSSPRSLSIRSVELTEPENRLVVAADGTTNVARALKLAPAPSGGALASAVPPTPAPPAGQPFRIAIASIRIQGGRLSYVDRSLEPNAALFLSDLEGTYTGLSTEPETASAVDLKGLAGGLAPLRIQGHATPLRHDLDTDLSLAIHGAELSDFSPYAGKFLGYSIRKGKLDLDARIRIRQRRLEVQDKVRMDQFFLGDRVESPDATRLPVRLGLALLRDRKGVMDLELPIEGSLDDPDFRYGKLVWKAVVNVLGKLVASPFTLLGKLFGGGDRDLSVVAFAPGSAALDEAALRTVGVLETSMVEWPDLALEVEATADPASDGAALKKAALDRLLRQAKARALRARQPDLDEDSLAMPPEERERWIREAYQAAFPAPALLKEKTQEAAQPPPPPAEMEQRLLGTLTVLPGDLQQLADARAKAVVKALAKGGKVEAARVFETTGGERPRKEGGSRAYFSLR